MRVGNYCIYIPDYLRSASSIMVFIELYKLLLTFLDFAIIPILKFHNKFIELPLSLLVYLLMHISLEVIPCLH